MSDPIASGGAGSQPIDSRARELFDKAASVAQKQPDYAILLYLQGLVTAPDHVPAHEGLRSVALSRKSAGGGSLGIHVTTAPPQVQSVTSPATSFPRSTYATIRCFPAARL